MLVRGRRRWAISVVGAVAALALLAAEGGAEGPIKDDTNTGLSFDVVVSKQAWDGEISVENTGSEMLVLDFVRLEGRSHGLRFLGAYSHQKTDPFQVSLANGRSWPPPKAARPYRPLAGTPVRPARELEEGTEQTQILLRLRPPARPRGVGFDALRLGYHVGDQHYVVRIRHALTLCARPRGKPEICNSDNP